MTMTMTMTMTMRLMSWLGLLCPRNEVVLERVMT